jgi:sugar lactone lactonase YvrE
VDSSGHLYFVDARTQTIYRWSEATRELSKIRDHPLDPVQLFFDKSGDLIVVSNSGDGTVYSFRPDAENDDITLINPTPAAPRPNLTPILPVDYWRNENDILQDVTATQPYQFLSPDGTTFLPAGNNFVNGDLYYGSKLNDTLRAFGFARAIIGRSFYVSDEEEEKTYVGEVTADGTLSNLKLFAERGGEGVAVDDKGKVYIAAGQVFVYSPSGKLIGTIEVPERPSQLLFGGQAGKTLFILARGSLYATRPHF